MTIRLNDTGSSVKELQTALKNAGYNITVDGYFGQETLGFVKDYQKNSGLSATGVVDSALWDTLNGVTADDTGSSVSDALLDLMEKFNSAPGYTAKTEEQIRKQAADEYKGYYDALRQGAQHAFDRSDLALQQQKEGLQQSYDKQRDQSAKNYRQAYSQADRQMLSRGMQRSSYGAQTLSNIDLEGAEAQQDINDAQTAAESNIDAQRAQLAGQLADQLAQYGASEQADIMARIRELQDQEYDRGLTAQNRQDSIALQLYQLMYQEGRDKVSDSQWQKQFDESARQFEERYGSSGGSGGSSGSSSKSTSTDPSSSGLSWGDFLAALGSTGNKATTGGVATSFMGSEGANVSLNNRLPNLVTQTHRR